MPSWLNINNNNLTFSGIPPVTSIGIVSIKITALDEYLLEVIEEFDLVINEPPNQSPTIINPIPDQTIFVNESFEFSISPNTFIDPDGGILEYSARLENDTNLPIWLAFNPSNLLFTGTAKADDIGVYEIKIIAQDPTSSSVFDVFQLQVKKQLITSNTNLSSEMFFYPNPSQDHIVLDLIPDKLFILQILSAQSQTILQRYVRNKEIISIQDISPGLYLITLEDENGLTQFSKLSIFR